MQPLNYPLSDTEEYKRKGYWTEETAAELWDKVARLYPDKEALVDTRRRLTWAQANLLTDRLAVGLLELGLQKDEPVIAQVATRYYR